MDVSIKIQQKSNFVVLIGSLQFWKSWLFQTCYNVKRDEISFLGIIFTEMHLQRFFFDVTVFANKMMISHLDKDNGMSAALAVSIQFTNGSEPIMDIFSFPQMVILNVTKMVFRFWISEAFEITCKLWKLTLDNFPGYLGRSTIKDGTLLWILFLSVNQTSSKMGPVVLEYTVFGRFPKVQEWSV